MKIETLAIHAGFQPDPTTKSVATPIYQTTSYAFDDTQHGADLFDLKVPGNIYTRIMNPTSDVLEKRLAALEGGVGGLALASGMAAVTYSLFTICESGDNVVTTSTLYGGTYNLFAHTLPQLGIEIRFAAPNDIDGMAALIDQRTKAVFCESIGNPAGNVADIGAMADMAHAHGIPLIVDNTVPTPYLCRPFEYGADIVVHALTKYLGGHGTTIGGALVDSGKFPWAEHKARFRRLNEPDVSYHGVVYTEALGPAAYIGRARVVPLRNMGAAISPFNSFLILQGIETLHVRMDRHCDNALAVAQFLQAQPQLATRLIQLLSERIWTAYRQLENLMIRDHLGRIYDTLLIQIEKQKIKITPKQSHNFEFGFRELFNMVGLPAEKTDMLSVQVLEDKHFKLEEGKLICTDLDELEKSVQFYRKKSIMERKREAQKSS